MKIIFLNVDGVLNSAQDHYSKSLSTKSHLKLLAWIVKQTDAKVVLTSSWRLIPQMFRSVDEKLLSYDIDLIDKTRSLSGSRGAEIKDWIDHCIYDVESFVILDDDADMDEFTSTNLVQTDSSVGLQKRDAEKALQILGKTRGKVL